MELVTTRGLIRKLLARWRRQYPPRLHEVPGKVTRHGEVAARIAALDVETATADDVKRLIGNDSWTDIGCDECGAKVTAAVRFEEPEDRDSRTFLVCPRCLRQAMDMLDGGYDGEETRL